MWFYRLVAEKLFQTQGESSQPEQKSYTFSTTIASCESTISTYHEVWSGRIAGSFRLERGRLVIATRHQRHSASAKACKWSRREALLAEIEALVTEE